MRMAAILALALAIGAAANAADSSKTKSSDTLERRAVRIPMPDGTRLFACLTLPRGAAGGERFPVLLTSEPYAVDRCSDHVRPLYRGLAQAGYAVAYVHVRGTGLSGGTFPSREYSEEELDDEVHLIDWLSRQPWSTGRIGMFGESWSGFNALQVAMRNPPALKAIIAAVATEDLYHEDAHYQDGIMVFNDWDGFADLQLISVPEPADPFSQGTLTQRFDQPPWSLLYLKHQRDGDFWRRGIRLDQPTAHLTVPTLMIGGWYDGYRQAVLRGLEHAEAPFRAVVGPWEHERNQPAPLADQTAIAVRWWDQWLKASPPTAPDLPQLIAYMRRPYLPRVGIGAIPGEWRVVPKWSERQASEHHYYFAAGHALIDAPASPTSEQLRYVATSGNEVGIWWGDPMPDQRAADAYSLIYETRPVDRELSILGSPEVHLSVSTTASRANWMVRLEDVAPDGTVTQITGKALNGTHRNSSVEPEPLKPGEVYALSIPLLFTSWIFEPGHKIRVAVSNAQFPMYWPTSEPMTTRIELGGSAGSSLTLPLLPPAPPGSAEMAAQLVGSRNLSVLEAAAVPPEKVQDLNWIGPAHIERDVPSGVTTVRYGYGYHGEFQVSSTPGDTMFLEYQARDDDPAHARATARVITERRWHGHRVRWQGQTQITSDATQFHYLHRRELLEDGKVIREKVWTQDVPRDFQ
jgi:putative CocE/NonD family hydrolase